MTLKKIAVFKNGVNLEYFKPGEKDPILVNKLGLKDKFIVGYIGTHGMAHGLDFILESIKGLELKHPELLFLFVGDGAEKKNLIRQADELKLKNVLFLDSVAKSEVRSYLNLMDVALVNLRKSETFQTVIPSKIFEAAAMEKPILLGLEGESKEIIESYGAGICYHPEDQKSFYKASGSDQSTPILFKSTVWCQDTGSKF